MTRRKLIAVVTAASLLAPASLAWAHTELNSVSPRKNSTRKTVRSVHATFTGSLITGTITIKTSSGRVVPLKRNGLKANNKRVLEAIPRRPLASGRYVVEWRARASDGHSQRGSWRFRVRR